MRIRRVVAHAFGPFVEEALELAEGMTVVAGPNEAGKSSWHAATRLALTGLRRGRGRTTKEDAALAERHRPWDNPDRWEVEARLDLDDGRTIDINQDLAGKVACRAVDVALGRDVSDEILDGTPDASRWLGLDRDAFATTVSVNQAEIMAVAEAADALQEQMQRAASTRGTDATAAQAIERLTDFRREVVGADTIAAKGPLRMGRNRLAAATEALAVARQRHVAYLDETRRTEEAERRVTAARGELTLAEAAAARLRARRSTEQAARATALAARHPAPPPALSARDAAADLVASAISGWERRPAPVELAGASSASITEELARLPAAPGGPLQPEPELRGLLAELDRAEEALGLLAPQHALLEAPPDDLAGQAERMRALARRLASPTPVGAEALETELVEARQAASGAGRPGILSTALGLALAIAGVVLALVTGPLIGGAALVAGLLVAGWGWMAGSTARAADRRVAAAEAALAPYRIALERSADDRRAAAREARQAGWPDDAAALDALADRTHEMVRDAARDLSLAAEERARRASVEARRDDAARRLTRALAEHGIAGHPDARAAWSAYEASCSERARQAAEAAQAEPLRRALASRRAAEETAAGVRRAIDAARAGLVQAAEAAGVAPNPDPGRLVEELRAWQAARAASMTTNQRAIEEWRELTSLLDGRTLDAIREEARERAREADQRARGLDDAEIDHLAGRPDLESVVADRRRATAEVERVAHALRGGLDVLAIGVPDVAAAEEAVESATAELARVQALATTIDETLRLLREAQDRVHRDLAPVLAQAVGRWLPVVSGGAYVEVSVDPANLAVTVKEAATGLWRQARLLSAGTREQIYLLLRVAMAQHLVTTGETAPLLLDEVTAQADPERRAGLLRVLHELSRERQVILFSHDEAVAAWAERSLAAPRDCLVRLAGRTARASGSGADGGHPGEMADPRPTTLTLSA